jgi:hypothetical protein
MEFRESSELGRAADRLRGLPPLDDGDGGDDSSLMEGLAERGEEAGGRKEAGEDPLW